MTAILRIFISESWPRQPKARWILRDAGQILQEGVSEPQYWPEAREHQAVLSAAQAVWLRTRLPARLPRAEFPRLLASALEDQMLDEPERAHLTVTDRREGEVGVLVVARERMRQICAQFAALGRPLSRLACELQTAPGEGGAWHLTFATDTAILRRGNRDGAALDAVPDTSGEAAAPALLPPLLNAARGAGAAPSALVVHAAEGEAAPDLARWEPALGLPVHAGAPHAWYENVDAAANLLQGEFAARHGRRAWLVRLRPAVYLAAAVLAVDLLAGVGQVGWQRYQLAVLNQRLATMFQGAFPGVPAIDPPLQMRRQLDQLRGAAGQLRSDDALTMLAALSDSLGGAGHGAIAQLRFDEGALEVAMQPSTAGNVEAVQRQLALRGYNALVRNDGSGPPRLVVRVGEAP